MLYFHAVNQYNKGFIVKVNTKTSWKSSYAGFPNQNTRMVTVLLIDIKISNSYLYYNGICVYLCD